MSVALQLEIRRHGAVYGRAVPHTTPVRIGSGSKADVRLRDEGVDPVHVEIGPGPGAMVLAKDLSAGRGMLVNGMRLTHAEIHPGDVITLGDHELEIREAHVEHEVVDPDRYVETPATATPEEERSAVELYVFWNGRVIAVEHLGDGRGYTLGTEKGCDLMLPEEVLGDTTSFDLVAAQKGRTPVIDLSLGGMTGRVRTREGKIVDLQDAARSGHGGLTIEHGVRARIDLGAFTFLLGSVGMRRAPKSAFGDMFNATVVLFLALSLLGHMAFLIGLQLVPEDPLLLAEARYKRRQEVIEVIQIARREQLRKEAEEMKKEPEKIKTKRVAKSEKPQAGDERIKTRRPDSDPDALTNKLTPEDLLKRNKERVDRSAMVQSLRNQTDLLTETLNSGTDVLHAGDQTLRALMSRDSDGDESLAASNLNPFGGTLGGPGNGGFPGTGGPSGASGPGGGPGMGIAELSKGGMERDKVKVRFEKPKRKSRIFSDDSISVRGGYDKDIIRNYIRGRLRQLRWCHQKAIQRSRDVGGKIRVQFMITMTGQVLRPSVISTTVGNPDLEACVISKISLWKFPPPRLTGATAIVRYPFIFKVVK